MQDRRDAPKSKTCLLRLDVMEGSAEHCCSMIGN